jgi:ketosteroid isomerase-like protein
MSEQNVELHRRAYEAFKAHDMEPFIACFDPSIEWHSVMTVPGGAVYHGHDGVIAFAVLHGRGRQSGVEAAMPIAQLMRWRDGLGVYFKAYVQREDALRELGISEDALEPIAP